MRLTVEEMRVIREALLIAQSKYDIELQIALHNYEEQTGHLIRRKVEINNLLDKIGRRYE